MAPNKNLAAETLPRAAAEKAGVMTFSDKDEVARTIGSKLNSRKLFGFSRKQLPPDLPSEPQFFIFSISEYGENVMLCAGLPNFEIKPCPEDQEYGPACPILSIYFFEEAKVDVTEHTPHTGRQIADAILKVGPGMNASWDRGRVGWFVSKTDPPQQVDLDRAKEVYLKECQRLVAEGNRYAQANQLNEINETHRRAAKYTKQKVDWDKPMHKMVTCPGCGEPVRAGAILHAVPYCGYVFNWEAAIESGMKKLEDAPSEVLKKLQK